MPLKLVKGITGFRYYPLIIDLVRSRYKFMKGTLEGEKIGKQGRKVRRRREALFAGLNLLWF